jgi:glycosyltransferase involved in cell wall biosynthesis
MKIAFDHQIFMAQPYGGISRYFVRLAGELIASSEDVRVVAPCHCNRYLGALPRENVIGREFRKLPGKISRLTAALNRHVGEREINRFGPTIFHETYYTQHAVRASGAARILTVYDMIHERFSDSFPRHDNTTLYKRAAVDRADHIICISHSTKRDLCEIFQIPHEKVSVVHLGFDKFQEPTEDTQGNVTNSPFLLYVGNRGGYKNFGSMLRAVASRQHLRDTFDIVSFGGSGFNASELRVIKEAGLREGSVHHVNGGDFVLGQLYRKATAFVYPSLYEGFGLPPLEAMAHGCPVVTSNTSSMPEVVGEAGEFFSPSDIDEQAQAIENVVFSSSRREGLIRLGRERLGSFSWQNCAKETRDVYREFS